MAVDGLQVCFAGWCRVRAGCIRVEEGRTLLLDYKENTMEQNMTWRT